MLLPGGYYPMKGRFSIRKESITGYELGNYYKPINQYWWILRRAGVMVGAGPDWNHIVELCKKLMYS